MDARGWRELLDLDGKKRGRNNLPEPTHRDRYEVQDERKQIDGNAARGFKS
jgi:hypothetical protein